jgi:hypothetical protein
MSQGAASLLGVLGLVVAAPLTVTAVVLLKTLYVEDALGDQTVEVPGEPGNKVHETGTGMPVPARRANVGGRP